VSAPADGSRASEVTHRELPGLPIIGYAMSMDSLYSFRARHISAPQQARDSSKITRIQSRTGIFSPPAKFKNRK
jgi:hypothetical protein